jgi:hypothetical protein
MTEAEKRAWLAGLKPGDEVAVCRHNTVPEVRLVTKRDSRGNGGTILVGGLRFHGAGGYLRGDNNYSLHIEPVTDRVRREVTFARDARRLSTLHDTMRRMSREAAHTYDADAVSAAIAENERLLGVP